MDQERIMSISLSPQKIAHEQKNGQDRADNKASRFARSMRPGGAPMSTA
ncbi:MAG TPA: hypothetical protein VIY71_03030 [Solirubrobacterales bacterium]